METIMTTPPDDPTRSQFGAYCAAYDYFNHALFDGKLRRCMLNFSRKTRRVLGFFAPQRWEHSGVRAHEISLNPDLLYRPTLDVMSTLCHEMAHGWQEEFGQPSRSGYHNAEWARKMEEIGLMPSHTGKPRGRRTGQQMSHYVIEGGAFQQAFQSMPCEHLLPWQSGCIAESRRGDRNKVTYLCPGGCGAKVWGRPHLSIACGVCQVFFLPCSASQASA
jgi:hypothetical protein